MKAMRDFEKRNRLVREVIETVILTGLMFVIINLAIQNYTVDGASMESSLHNNEDIMVDKVSYHLHDPQRGDIVVFVAPPEPSKDYVKRIIGVPGDTINVDGTKVTVDGVVLQETYVSASVQGVSGEPVHNLLIPKDKYFVMGDDRRNSFDSRSWGLLPRGNIVGRAALVYWPFGQDNSGFLPDVSRVFAHVHQAKPVAPAA